MVWYFTTLANASGFKKCFDIWIGNKTQKLTLLTDIFLILKQLRVYYR